MSEERMTAGTPKKVLIVDDDRLILATLARGLRQAGYDVSEASSAADALRSLTEAPDIALLDVRMPGMSGIEFAQRLQQTTNIPFLFLSAFSDMDLVREAAEAGSLGYLVKPMDIPQVVAAIEAALVHGSEVKRLKENEQTLLRMLEASRETSAAMGVLMERNRLGRKKAFDALRDHARSRRRKINDFATEILDALEKVNLQSD